ncbi:MAG: hypothetical protein K0R29_1991 [Pseudobdellovibrio sp.]|jgi:uncharacterized protein (TIGR02147 family)|nr:hypothetical protein [Pseudobdellovibrio sp.]
MSIFEHVDYRDYLRNYIKKLPKRGRGEIHKMAQFMGIHPSLLSQVLSDSKNLTLEQAQLLAKYLGLTNTECEFLFCSVQIQRAGTKDLENYFKGKLADLKKHSQDLSKTVRQDRQLNAEEISVFYSHWLYAAIWLMSSLTGGRTLEDIVNWFQIPRERAIDVLQFLVNTGLCKIENGRYVMGPQSVHLQRGSPYLPRHHSNWRLRAIETSDKLGADELMYTAPMSMSVADFKKVRSRLNEVIKEVTDIAIPSEAEEMVCFNLDFFWIRK